MPAEVGLQFADYVAVVVYLLVTVAIVYRSSRAGDDTEDFFLGGRSMPWFAVGLSIMATLLSTNTYLGAPGEMIKYGPAYMLGYVAYPFLACVVMYLWIPFFMRLRMTSAYEYLELRFDRRLRRVGNVLFWGLRFGWMAMVICTASLAMVRMAYGPVSPGMLYVVIGVIGLVATIYACFGGMRAVIWTDVLQALMLFGGVLLIIGKVWLVDGSGIPTWWNTIVRDSPDRTPVILASWDIAERTTIVWGIMANFFWHVCTHCSDQVALQRYFTTTSLQAARRSFVVSILSGVAIGLLLSIAGLALRYYYLQRPGELAAADIPRDAADQVMPYFYATALPAGFCGLVLVSFLCDAMQTLVSGVNSIAATITTSVSDERRGGWSEMILARAVVLIVGVITTGLAIFGASVMLNMGRSIFDMLPKMFNLFLGPLAALFITGMFVTRARARTALIAVACAMVFSFTWSWWSEIALMLEWAGCESLAESWINVFGRDALTQKPRVPTPMLAVATPCVVGVVLAMLLSRFEPQGPHSGTPYSWRETMRREPLGREA
ncbi:MAG: hypothetical protein JNM18_02240 [Planctomycetaceae bacterium]|nr:hypothetical protein [Planctomycetaceae bacterium]